MKRDLVMWDKYCILTDIRCLYNVTSNVYHTMPPSISLPISKQLYSMYAGETVSISMGSGSGQCEPESLDFDGSPHARKKGPHPGFPASWR